MEADDGSGLTTWSVKRGTKLWGESRDNKVRGLNNIVETYCCGRARGRSWKMLEKELGCIKWCLQDFGSTFVYLFLEGDPEMRIN